MNQPACHSFSAHIRAAERTCCVQADAVTWSDSRGARGRIEFTQLRRVRLRNPPGMDVPSIGLLDLYPLRGPRLRVSSLHFIGFGRSEDRSASFRGFALALHQALVPHASAIDFRLGSTWLGAATLAALVGVWAALLTLGAAGLLFGDLPWWSALVLVALVPQGLLLVRHLRRHWPRRYDPRAVPMHMLPGR